MQEKKILDVTCGSRTIWFNKHRIIRQRSIVTKGIVIYLIRLLVI